MSVFIPKISKLSTRIIRILGCNPSPMTLQGTNTYIIGTGENRILLDCGNPNVSEYVELLKNVLTEQKCLLKQIIISHWHLDHIGGVHDILKEIKNECVVSKLPRSSGVENSITPSINYNYLKDGDIITADGVTLRVIATPGHADDHLVLYLEEEGNLFSGDCILGEGTAVFEDLHDYMESLDKILKLEPLKIFPGHGPVIDSPKTKIVEYIQHRLKREKQIVDELKKVGAEGLTAEELVNIIYVDTPKHLYKAAENNVYHHLSKLFKSKIIGKVEEKHEENEKYFFIPCN